MPEPFELEREHFYSVLNTCREKLIEELQKEVIFYFYDKKVLTEEEFESATAYDDRESQIGYFLDRLPSKGEAAYQVFLRYIDDSYHWIGQYFEKQHCSTNSEQELQEILADGDVQPLPATPINRKAEFAELCNYLHILKRNEYVVVHGMRGCGKSTLVSYVLNHSKSLVFDAFKEKVFWITVGRDSPSEELTLQQELCSKLMSSYPYPSNNLPLDPKAAKTFLKERFRKDELKDSLLILDDVSKASFVDAFDIGCKILITTDDDSIMNRISPERIHYVKMTDGFTEAESVELFSQSINIKPDKLPKEARVIHAISKGFPLTISLLASQLADFKEDAQINNARWNFYITKLKAEGVDSALGKHDRYRADQVSLLFKTIGMSIDSLTPEEQDCYQDFALFMSDVNIKPEVLCTLWGMDDKTEVEDIMYQFQKKCLVIRAQNTSKNPYIYSIHDLLLDYLKRKLGASERQALHRRLIETYKTKYGDDVENFPVDDNYIFLYIGYHLKEAGLVNEFPRTYLNLEFIEKKMKYFGAADLLFDFKRYKRLIATDEENTKKYEDFVYFITRVAACKSISNSDIVQFALCESKQSAVYKAAIILKNYGRKPHVSSKYFHFLTDTPKEDSPPTVYYGKQKIMACAFINDTDVIIANEAGVIRRINIASNCTVKTFEGHTDKVTSLQLSKKYPYFLSASDDATVRVWSVDGSFSPTNTYEKPRTPSPQFRQSDWLDMWQRQRNCGEAAKLVLSRHILPIKDAQFANNSLNIVTTAGDFQVIFWNVLMEKLQDDSELTPYGVNIKKAKENMESCCFSNDDKYVLCAAHGGVIYIYESADGQLKSTQTCEYEIKSMIVIPEISQVAALLLGEKYFCVMDIVTSKNVNAITSKNTYETSERRRNDDYICAAVSWNGKYVAIASTNYNIRIYETLTGKKVLKFNESNGKICNLSWSRHNDKLLASYQSNILKIWNVQSDGVLLSPDSVKLDYNLFDAVWIPNDDEDSIGDSFEDGDFISVAVASDKTINVFDNLRLYEVIKNPLNVPITQICISPKRDIIYSYKEGRVFLKTEENEEIREIMDVQCYRVRKLQAFSTQSQLLVVALAENENYQSILEAWYKVDNETSVSETKISFVKNSMERVNDFVADLNNNKLYVTGSHHTLNVYRIDSGLPEYSGELDAFEIEPEVDCVLFSDISSMFSLVATGNRDQLFIRAVSDKIHEFSTITETNMKMCKFSPNERYLAVGFDSGYVHIYNVENLSKVQSIYEGKCKFFPGSVVEVTWSSSSSRFIVTCEREISLYEINVSGAVNLLATLYMSVDKLICNPTFSKCVTVDFPGHFRALQLPS